MQTTRRKPASWSFPRYDWHKPWWGRALRHACCSPRLLSWTHRPIRTFAPFRRRASPFPRASAQKILPFAPVAPDPGQSLGTLRSRPTAAPAAPVAHLHRVAHFPQQYRNSVKDIVQVLKNHKPLVKPSIFVGQAAGTSGGGLKQREVCLYAWPMASETNDIKSATPPCHTSQRAVLNLPSPLHP